MTQGDKAKTMLLVEDEPMVLRLGRTVLERSGYAVLTAGTPAEAVTVAGAHDGTIDLLITDVVMPDMHGRELAALLAETRPGIQTLFVSGYPATTLTANGSLASNAAFLQKPFSVDQFTQRVGALLGTL